MWFAPYFNIYLEPKTKKKLAEFENDLCFQNVFSRFYRMALNRYDFKDLPSTCDERVIKQSLITVGAVTFFQPLNEENIFSLPGIPDGGGFNIYDYPLSGTVYARNGVFNEHVNFYVHGGVDSKMLSKSNGTITPATNFGVFVMENELCYPFINHVIYYAKAVSDTLRAIDVCRSNLKTPFIISAQEEVINSVKKFFDDRDKNMNFIVSSGVFPANKIQLLPISTSADAIKALSEICDWYEQRFREICGFNSLSQIDKKGENLIEAEVDVNNEVQDVNVDSALKSIQRGLEDVNFIFGTNISVYRKESNNNDDIQRDGGKDTQPIPRGSEGDRQTDTE